MSSVFRPGTPGDQDRIIDLLTRAFHLGPDAPFVQSELVRWKYWEPRADYRDPRSFVVEKEGRLVAHVGLWPVEVQTAAGTLRGIHMIDWASDPQSPGAGVSLLQRLTRNYDFIYSIGGSDMTETILPRFGFRETAAALTFARPLRPWRQILHHQSRDLRLPLRLARNLGWSKHPAREALAEWSAAAAAVDGLRALVRERGLEFLRYLERCPSTRVSGYHVLRNGRPAGFFFISVVNRQARLGGAWLDAPDADSWYAALQLAQDAALRHTAACEFVARAISPAAIAGAQRAGLRVRGSKPVFVFAKNNAGDQLPLEFQMCDNDEVFLGAGNSEEFLT